MCGIVGYVGEQQCVPILVGGLKKLEYRGYDSAGVAVFTAKGIKVIKSKGRLSALEKRIAAQGMPEGVMGIGHTRWATHGEPSDVNSHPHKAEKAVVVHNGIIENYLEIRSSLEAKGIAFVSQTDTEAAAHLISFYYHGDPIAAIQSAIARIRGSYALGIMFTDRPDTLYAVRKDSPLIVGEGDGQNFIASDIPAILSHTRDYYLLDEQEIAVLTRDSIRFVDLYGETVVKEKITATWDVSAAEKAGYPHFMLKEIYEQPRALKDTLCPRLADGLTGILETELDGLPVPERIHLVGCGSAMHAAMLGRNAIEKYARIPVTVDIASEFRYRAPILAKGDLCVIISQSGETADTLAALRLAKRQGVPVAAIVNVVGSSIAREADYVMYTWAGPEIAVATTKAFSCQTAMLYLLALRLSLQRKTLTEKEAGNLAQALCDLPALVGAALQSDGDCKRLASLYQNSHDLFFIGRGQDYCLCCEGSLKLKEISYMHSEAYAAGELKHGTISLVTEGMPVIAVTTEAALYEKTVSNIKEVKARGASVVLLTSVPDAGSADFADHVIALPQAQELVLPLAGVVVLQLFAYYTAVLRGCDVDKPRNLAKSVTVE